MSQSGSYDLKVIVFQLKSEEYAIPVDQVQSIERMQHITRVPRVTDFIKGVINLRGVVTPIIDLRKRFQIEEAAYTESTRIIITHVEEKNIGLIVDSANDVIDIPGGFIEPPPEVVGSVETKYISGIAKLERRLLILLDPEKVFSNDEVKIEG
jgi:purine-binding chemotaxis protein CheW